MAKTYDEYLNKVRDKTQAGGQLRTEDLQDALDRAVTEYSELNKRRDNTAWVLTTDSINVPDADFWIVVYLACAYACEDLAQKFTFTTDKAPQADFSMFNTKRAELKAQAVSFREDAGRLTPTSEEAVTNLTSAMPTLFGLATGRRGA